MGRTHTDDGHEIRNGVTCGGHEIPGSRRPSLLFPLGQGLSYEHHPLSLCGLCIPRDALTYLGPGSCAACVAAERADYMDFLDLQE